MVAVWTGSREGQLSVLAFFHRHFWPHWVKPSHANFAFPSPVLWSCPRVGPSCAGCASKQGCADISRLPPTCSKPSSPSQSCVMQIDTRLVPVQENLSERCFLKSVCSAVVTFVASRWISLAPLSNICCVFLFSSCSFSAASEDVFSGQRWWKNDVSCRASS